ncbi:MAG: hypothetical protein IKW64_04525 [Clostridia bacterium]|nr:hypothetical protein [Clostridia bacterium]
MSTFKPSRQLVFCILVLILSVFRFSYLGFRYTPYLDDYIQYYFYPSFNQPWNTILAGGAGVLFTRPLAGLFDFFIWSRLNNMLWLAVIIISLLHGMSAILFQKAFERMGISLGSIFIIFYLFLPLNTEGTYWLSASSRIVVSLFLISASVLFAASGKTVLFAIFNFMSLWFYEQTAVLSAILGIIFCVLEKRPAKIVIPIFNIMLLAAFYLRFGRLGDNAARLAPISAQSFIPHTFKTIGTALNILGPVSLQLTATGFVRGIEKIFSDLSFLWFGVSGFLSVLLIMSSSTYTKTPLKIRIFLGIALIFAPQLPFILTSSNSINLRNIVPCLLGIAIIADALLPLLFKSFTPVIASLCLIVFSVAAVSEVCDYEKTARHDLALAQKISENINTNTTEISVKLTSPAYLPQNAPYGDHIKSMVASDWGISGIVRTVSGNKKVIVKIRN